MKTTANYLQEMQHKLEATEARFRSRAWWHPLFHLNVLRLIWRDILARIGVAQRKAAKAALYDHEAAEIIRRAMSDGIDETDRSALNEALRRIDLSRRQDDALSRELKV